jgi:hypothetical protein
MAGGGNMASAGGSAIPGSNNGNSTLPMKLNDMRDSHDLDSDTEERI